MSKALIAGINQVAVDKGLDREIIFEAIEAALVSAYKRNFGSVANVTAEVDRVSGEMRVLAEKEVVDEVLNPRTEIQLQEARKVDAAAELHDVVKIKSTPGSFGRIAAQTAKQVILQRIREAERDTVYESFVHKVGEIINAQVRSIDTISGTVTVLLDEKHESLLPRDEQIAKERLRRGDYIRLYVVDVQKGSRGPMIKLSRTHRNLLRRLMEQEIPEVRQGTVEIKNIAREPGARSKVAVMATVSNIDPVGSCVGMRGMRIQNIVNELAGEKIDVVEWSTDLRLYIANSLSPAKVNSVLLDEGSTIKTATVIVPDRQLSLAIGKAGQNARLAAKLTGWRIDIKSESEALAEGLDLTAAEQAQLAGSRQGDLLARAEQILRREGHGPGGEDLLERAARLLRQSAEKDGQAETAGVDADLMPMFGELPAADQPRIDLLAEAAKKLGIEKESRRDDQLSETADRLATAPLVPTFDDEPAQTAAKAGDPSLPTTAKEQAAPVAPAAGPEAAGDESREAPLDVAEMEQMAGAVDSLPEVITADMLRARRAKKTVLDFEIPAELLAGLYDADEEEEEDLDELIETKGKAKRKPKVPAKPVAARKTKKKRRGAYSDLEDEFE